MRGQDETRNREQLMWVDRYEDGPHPEWAAQPVTDADLRRMRDELLEILLTPRELKFIDAAGTRATTYVDGDFGFITWDGSLEALSDEALKAMFGNRLVKIVPMDLDHEA